MACYVFEYGRDNIGDGNGACCYFGKVDTVVYSVVDVGNALPTLRPFGTVTRCRSLGTQMRPLYAWKGCQGQLRTPVLKTCNNLRPANRRNNLRLHACTAASYCYDNYQQLELLRQTKNNSKAGDASEDTTFFVITLGAGMNLIGVHCTISNKIKQNATNNQMNNKTGSKNGAGFWLLHVACWKFECKRSHHVKSESS